MAPGVGIEPTIAESKSVVLPLHYPGTNKTGYIFSFIPKKVIEVAVSILKLVALDSFEMSTYRLSSDCSSSELQGYIGVPPRTRTLTNSFGDCHAAITLEIHIEFVSCAATLSAPFTRLYKSGRDSVRYLG